MVRVSIIIPTYNRAHLLNRAIESVLNQTFLDAEIIIVDDASTDGTDNLLKSFDNHRIIRLRNDKNKGCSAARNTGIKKARGEFIAFLDSDDEWLPDKLEKQMKVFAGAADRVGVVYAGYFDEAGQSRAVIPRFYGNIFNYLITRNVVSGCSIPLVRKECFDQIGFFDETLRCCGDWDMWIRIARRYEFEFVPEALVRYYRQADSISMDKTAVLKSHKLISQRYYSNIKALPKALRAEHYIFMGRIFQLAQGSMGRAQYFFKMFFLDPLLIPNLAAYVLQGMGRKISGRLLP